MFRPDSIPDAEHRLLHVQWAFFGHLPAAIQVDSKLIRDLIDTAQQYQRDANELRRRNNLWQDHLERIHHTICDYGQPRDWMDPMDSEGGLE